MSIYVTGDCHGGFQRVTTKNFPHLKGMNREADGFPGNSEGAVPVQPMVLRALSYQPGD